MFLWCVRGRWKDIYSGRGLLLPISSSRSQGVPTLAPTCKLVRDASDWLRVPRLTAIFCTLPKSDRMVLIRWSPSGYTPIRSECPDALSSSCLLITRWQLVIAHGVTRNEPKIPVICYITPRIWKRNWKLRNERRIKAILTTSLLRFPWILWKVLESWSDLSSFRPQRKVAVTTDVKNKQYLYWFGLIYGIWTFVGYSMPNPLYIFILNI